MAVVRKADFEPHIATVFELAPAGVEPVALELVEVKETSSGSLDSFSLLFKGSPDFVFRHNTYTVRHPVMGELDLFLGPVHTGKKDAVYYQAIFSTLRKM